MNRSLPEFEQQIDFRYSNRFVYYLIWFGGWMTWGAIVFFYGEEITQASYPVIDRYGTAGFIGVMGTIVISFVLWFLIAFLIARKVTDKHGTAFFCNTYAELHMGRRTLCIPYTQIGALKYRTVLNAQHGGTGFGPMLYRLHIKAGRRKHVIPCSFKEAWECKRNGNARPLIDLLAEQFCLRSGLDVKLVAR